MKKFTLQLILLSILISLTNEITCIICSSQNSLACNDPFNSTSVSYLLLSGYTYCRKNFFANGLVIRFGGSTCLTSNNCGIITSYCCSDRDFCNNAQNLTISLFSIILFMISPMFIKKIFLN